VKFLIRNEGANMPGRLLTVAFIVLLTGCAMPYEAPKSGKTASLEMHLVNSDLIQNSTVFIDDSYILGEHPSRYAHSHRYDKALSPDDNQPTYAIKSVVIAADKPIYIKYRGEADRSGNRRCLIQFKFVPQPDTQYMFTDFVSYDKKKDPDFIDRTIGFDHESVCRLFVFQKNGSKLIPVKLESPGFLETLGF
jgi:hypothetical protein